MSVSALELDLEVFTGPFDLLLTLVLREEVDLLDLPLAEIVLAYLDCLQAKGELDLETTTEFIVLVAALLELKSRLMLTGDEEELFDIEPQQALDELLARMLDAHRYRKAADHLRELLEREHGVRFRSAPLPPGLRLTIVPPAAGSEDPARLGEAIGDLLKMPPKINLEHVAVPRVPVAERLAHLRALLQRGSFTFDEAVRGADRMTVAVTLFALLELYKRGEAEWRQEHNFGDIDVHPRSAAANGLEGVGVAANGASRAASGGRGERPVRAVAG